MATLICSHVLIILAAAFIITKVRQMSQSVDSLTAACAALSAQVTAVADAVAALKAGQVDPKDAAAVDAASAQVTAATEALKAIVG